MGRDAGAGAGSVGAEVETVSYPWFRFYSEALTDRKIERICRNTDEPKVVVIGAWAILLALANDSPQRGALLLTDDIPVTAEDIAADLGIDIVRAGLLVHQFVRLGLIAESEGGVMSVTNWDARQFKSDSSAARTRKYREGKADGETTGNDYKKVTVTSQGRHSDGPDTDTETEKDSAPSAAETPELTGEAALDAVFGEKPPREPVKHRHWSERNHDPWRDWSGGKFQERDGVSVESQDRVAWLVEDITGLSPPGGNYTGWGNGAIACYNAGRGDWAVIEAGVRDAWGRESQFRPSTLACTKKNADKNGFVKAIGKARAEKRRPADLAPTSKPVRVYQ
jgi:hypothetical protein